MSRVLGPEGMRTYADVLRSSKFLDAPAEEFSALPADADERTRADLAKRLVPSVSELLDEHPGLNTLSSDAPRGARFAEQTAGKALLDVYNRAQLDVLYRTHILLNTPPDPEDG